MRIIEELVHQDLPEPVSIMAKIVTLLGFVLNAAGWLLDASINSWLALITGVLGIIYLVYRIGNAQIDRKIKKEKLNQMQNGKDSQ